MKKTAFLFIALIAMGTFLFTGCEKEKENQKPTCTITHPAAGSKIPKDTTIIITVIGEDLDGTISQGLLYLDGAEVWSANAFPFEYEWNTKEASTGSHRLVAEAIDDAGAVGEDTVQILVGYIPDAAFRADTTIVIVDSLVQFTDESAGEPTDWEWDFGDGTKSSEQNPSHGYASEGVYTLWLKVSNDYGSDTETKTDYITVGSPPVADFGVDTTLILQGNSVNFTDQSSGNPNNWMWDFGDGQTSSSQNPSHTYQYVGTYTVKLTASNKYGSHTTFKTDYLKVGNQEIRIEGEDLTESVGNDSCSWKQEVSVESGRTFQPVEQEYMGCSNDSLVWVDFGKHFQDEYAITFHAENMMPGKYRFIWNTSYRNSGIYSISVNGEKILLGLTEKEEIDTYNLVNGIFSILGYRLYPNSIGFCSVDGWVKNISEFGDAAIQLKYCGPGKSSDNGLVIDYVALELQKD
jgi:PKD repeat protein